MSDNTTVYMARRIVTLDDNCPSATHVAVRNGRILAVGDETDVYKWGEAKTDNRFQDCVLTPGFVEGHAHVLEGVVWGDMHYVGYFPRRAPDGTYHAGLKSIDEVVERLKEAEAEMDDANAALIAWGFDPIYFDGRRMTRQDLDAVSTTRPILVIHANFHLLNVNTRVLTLANVGPDTPVEGILRDSNGKPTGELQEMAAKFMAFRAVGRNLFSDTLQESEIRRYGQSARRAGVTTITDLLSSLDEANFDCYQRVTSEPDFPVRVVPALAAMMWDTSAGIDRLREIQSRGNEKLRLGLVKIMTDGSIQGFTGRLNWPGYFNGARNGIWNAPPAELKRMISAYHEAGFPVHIHANGDQASELAIDALQEALEAKPRADHRHTIQHCQMAERAQFQRMRALGIGVNLFANHVFYWGDQHHDLTLGPDRAARINAAATALQESVPFALHSDAPVTPLSPLFTAWCAVNRETATGRILGESQCITPEQAIRAVTLGAAWSIGMDGEIGSIEVGKYADFAVLEEDPLAVEPGRIRDIRVIDTVIDGKASSDSNPPRLQ